MVSSDDLKSSANIWGGNNVIENTQSTNNTNTNSGALRRTLSSDLPPSYTNAVESNPNSTAPQPPLNPLQELNLLASVNFSNYMIPQSTLSDDRTTTTITQLPIYTKPDVLAHLVQEQMSLPPRPMMIVRGTHTDDYMRTAVDFDLQFNLTSLLELAAPGDEGATTTTMMTRTAMQSRIRVKPVIAEENSSLSAQGSRLFSRSSGKRNSAANNTTTPLQIWCRKFCEDKSENKSFTVTRQILDFPTSILEGHVRTLLASLHYRGKVTISFPVHYSSLVIHKEPANWFVSMLRIYPVKKYEAIESLWDIRDGDGGGDGGARLAQIWWAEWKDVMSNAVLRKHRGRVGVEDWIEMRMGWRENEKSREWGVDGESSSWLGSN